MASATPTVPDAGEFREQRRRKRTEEAGPSSAKKQVWSKKSEGAVAACMSMIPTRNYIVPLRMRLIKTPQPQMKQSQSPVPSSNRPHCQKRQAGHLRRYCFNQLTEISRGIKTLYELYIWIPNHQEWNKGSYKGHDRLFGTNAPPWCS